MKRCLAACLCICALSLLAGSTRETVSIDENGVIQPPLARRAVEAAASAVVKVEIATARSEILTNLVDEASKLMEDVNRVLTEREDFAMVKIVATGIEDARGESQSASEGRIELVDNPVIDSTSDPNNVLVTLTWQYVTGAFSQPYATATAALGSDENPFVEVEWTGDPVQIEWGSVSAYVATAVLPKTIYSNAAFLKVNAKPDAPVDDGQVFDTYSDGTDITVRVRPTHEYDVRIVSGNVVGVTLVN